MTTVADILTASARTLGYLGRTEVMSAADATDALACFNRLLDSWSNEFLMSYVILQRSFTLTVGTQQYTIGTGGTINSTRPSNIITAFLRDQNNIDYPMQVIPREQWDQIGEKGNNSQLPFYLFYDSQYPLGIINIFPKPLLAYTVFFNTSTDQVEYSNLTTSLSLPVGFERCFVLNLALDMQSAGFPCLLDDKAFARLIENASEGKANIKRGNQKEFIAEYDPYLTINGNPTYNIFSDSYTR
jgi:hypothetical protein